MHRQPKKIPELTPERVEAQLRRASRWKLPHTPHAYPSPIRAPEFAAIEPTPRVSRPPRGLKRALVSGAVFHLCALIGLALATMPLDRFADEPSLTLSVVEARASESLRELPIDIATSRIAPNQWDHFDQPVGKPTEYAPLAVPRVPDQFIGNPLALLANSGGDSVVAGALGHATRGAQWAGATFSGVEARGQRFVFVLDNSLSMAGPAWGRAKREVLAGVALLQSGQRFQVIACDGSRPAVVSVDGMHSAQEDSAANLSQWLDSLRLVQFPDSFAAIKSALELRADAVYLIGAGAFGDLAADVRRENRWLDDDRIKVPGSVIHAIGIANSDDDTLGLAAIASENGGHFHRVSTIDP
ncbi:MAG: VWA domain-containing protein [Planctomycetales bacterium]|nr:VWA domain-containing protein [Planctomycetales bacterium]